MNVLEGKLTAKGMKVAIVVARFYEFITSKLMGGAVDCLVRHECAAEDNSAVYAYKCEKCKKVIIDYSSQNK